MLDIKDLQQLKDDLDEQSYELHLGRSAYSPEEYDRLQRSIIAKMEACELIIRHIYESYGVDPDDS